MKKEYFLIVDTETTQDSLVADFGAVICDRKGSIVTQCGVLTAGIYNNPVEHPLFFTSDSNGIWSKQGQDSRYAAYDRMLNSGVRMLASISAINRWLDRAAEQYQPILTAYNLPFDVDKCRKTGLDLNRFDRRFCLWSAAFTRWAHTRKYRDFVLECHGFNPPTERGNASYKTNAEIMARFVLGDMALPDEPHSALEDIVGYELPILQKLIRSKVSIKWLLSGLSAYDWRSVQIRDHYKAR